MINEETMVTTYQIYVDACNKKEIRKQNKMMMKRVLDGMIGDVTEDCMRDEILIEKRKEEVKMEISKGVLNEIIENVIKNENQIIA